MLCSWFAFWRPVRLQLLDGEEVAEDWTPAGAEKAGEYVNVNSSSRDDLM